MKKRKILFFCVASEFLLILSIAIAAMFSGILFALFYNVLYGLIISTIVPLCILVKNKETFSSVGIKRFSARQITVLLIFVLFSIGGQLLPKIILGEHIAWNVLPISIAPLIMTTFFEEFFFRGFIQSRMDKNFGCIVAILVSALMFSLYHLGYPGFRSFGDISLLFLVGLGFAIAFKLSDNNLIVSYFINLPNAFVTYMFKTEQFPALTVESNIYAVITIAAIIVAFLLAKPKCKSEIND